MTDWGLYGFAFCCVLDAYLFSIHLELVPPEALDLLARSVVGGIALEVGTLWGDVVPPAP